MINQSIEERFRQVVGNKYQVYNSLFMSLPYDKMTNIGMLIPFLYEESKQGYEQGKEPKQIISEFFDDHTSITSEDERIDLLFRFIQYIERQVVLFDSIEDSAFSQMHSEIENGTINSLKQQAIATAQEDEVCKKINDFGVRVVFTAHPTQFYTNEVQRILHDLRKAIQADAINTIDSLLQQLGLTPFLNETKPTPQQEATSIIYYLRHIYYDAVGDLIGEIKTKLCPDNFNNYDLVQLGFWPGGDRDGNPFVTAQTTWEVAEELRITILKCYYNHLKTIIRRLTFKRVTPLLQKLKDRLYANIFNGTKDLEAKEILAILAQVEELIKTKYNSLFLDELTSLKDRVQIFGTHFASLDIRQDSSAHLEVIQAIFKKEFDLNYDDTTENQRLELLTETSLSINPEDYEGLIQDTLKNVYQLKDIQKLNGERGVHRYIISNSETIWDVLTVYALFKYCGYLDEEIQFDIVPLFETIQGLNGSKATMNKLYNLPVYAKHLNRRKKRQSIMLGFSDGTKDGGYVKANWEIFQTKETLTEVSKDNQIDVIFFDGRGGPPARGGGKTHKFYASQGKTIANNQTELTIQGQTITSVYGTHDQAKYNFEQLLTAGVINDIFSEKRNNLSEEQRKTLNDLAELSYKKYSELKSHDKFVPYLETMSTLPYYGKTNIGSRPSKRGGGDGLEFSKLRAIPFVGSWSQLKQNVPGYFGFGSAIQQLKEEGRFNEVKKLFEDSAFFETLVLNSMMSMAKTYFPLTYYMKNNSEFGDFWKILHDEFILSREMMLALTGSDILMQNEPLSRLSVEFREKLVLPLLSIQQYALQKIQENPENKEAYENMVMRSLFGNINASRNSA